VPVPNPYTQAIGDIMTGRDVELAMLTFLRRWGGTYLAECERQRGYGPGALPRVRAYTTAADFEKWPEDQLPCLLLVSPGLAEAPLADGAGSYRVKFSVGLAVIVSAATMDETAALSKLYVAAMRAAILQHQSLEGFASGVEWLDETYDDLPSVDTRSLGAGQCIFAVEVRASLDVGTDRRRRKNRRRRTTRRFPKTRTPNACGSPPNPSRFPKGGNL
jgi:hypothetical protein